MANIQTFLENILSARYGKEVRQSIHDAIVEIDGVADTAQGSATEAAGIAVKSASEAEQYRTEAKQYRDEAVAVAGVEFATTEKAGLVKPDGETILIDPDGTIHSVGGSGGGGTVNYEELENKPSINGVELSGDLTTEDLNIDLGTVDYTELENKPSINCTELNGNKTLDDLGIASKTELEKTNAKVDTIIEKADLGIKNTASGEEIHLTDSAEGKAVEFALYGKATQDGEPTPENPQEIEVSGESYNLLENTATSRTLNGLTITVNNEDKSITVNGTATAWTDFNFTNNIYLKNGKYIFSTGINTEINTSYSLRMFGYDGSQYVEIDKIKSGEAIIEATSNYLFYKAQFGFSENSSFNNNTFYPMIRKASVTNDRYMPYGIGSVEVTSSNEYNTKNTKATIPTPNGLAGIKVSSNGNYTDQNGQQWICDEIVKYADGSGAYIQRIKKVTVTSETVASAGVSTAGTGEYITTTYKDCMNNNALSLAISNKANAVSYDNRVVNGSISRVYVQSGVLFIAMPVNSGFFTDTATAKEWLKNNEFECMYALAEPIHTPLTAEELAEISTFYPVTNISNDFDCGMKVKYNCDSKNYIDKQLALQAQAREQEMMAMFLLLPEETQAAMIENDVNNLLTESEI